MSTDHKTLTEQEAAEVPAAVPAETPAEVPAAVAVAVTSPIPSGSPSVSDPTLSSSPSLNSPPPTSTSIENLEKSGNQSSSVEDTLSTLLTEIDGAYHQIESRFSKLWLIASTTASDASNKLNLDAQKQELQSQLEGLRSTLSSVTAAGLALSPAMVREQLAEIEKKVPAVAAVQEQANTALDKLDEKLESVERTATRYVSGFRSFFSSIVSVEPSIDSDSLARASSELSNSVATDSSGTSSFGYGPSRHQTELYKLHTDPSLYTTAPAAVSGITISDRTIEIASLLKKYPELQKLMRELVPETVDYNSFWERYFYNVGQLTKQEEKRLALLQDPTKDDQFNWDDEEESVSTPPPPPPQSAAATPSAAESITQTIKDPKTTLKPTEVNAQESDDDWE